MATPITSVPGIGKATAFALSQNGFRSADDLAAADAEVLAAVPGFGVSRAARVIDSAQKLVGVSASPTDLVPAEATEAKESAEAGESTDFPTDGKKKKKQKKDKEDQKKSKAKKKDKKKGKKKSGKKKG